MALIRDLRSGGAVHAQKLPRYSDLTASPRRGNDATSGTGRLYSLAKTVAGTAMSAAGATVMCRSSSGAVC
jgi:hypothetical protein